MATSTEHGVVASPQASLALPSGDECPAQLRFPERLMKVLDSEGNRAFIWWFDDGRAFGIKPEMFTQRILYKNFDGTKNFHNFRRKLNRWGFKRAESREIPDDTVTYCHRFFVRGKPDLIKKMSGASKKPRRATAARAATDQDQGSFAAADAKRSFPVSAKQHDTTDSATVSLSSSSPLHHAARAGQTSSPLPELDTSSLMPGGMFPGPFGAGAPGFSSRCLSEQAMAGDQQALQLLFLQRRAQAHAQMPAPFAAPQAHAAVGQPFFIPGLYMAAPAPFGAATLPLQVSTLPVTTRASAHQPLLLQLHQQSLQQPGALHQKKTEENGMQMPDQQNVGS